MKHISAFIKYVVCIGSKHLCLARASEPPCALETTGEETEACGFLTEWLKAIEWHLTGPQDGHGRVKGCK